MARLSELGIDFDHWCFACGRLNDAGMHLDFEVSRDRAETRFVPERRHEGYDGTVHGGIVTALLDETMGWAIFHQGIWGVTTRLGVAFRRPVQVGEELHVVGEVVRQRSRAIETRGTVARARDGVLLAEADATFLVMPQARRRELERRYRLARTRPAPEATGEDERRLEGRRDYSGTDEAFARVREAVEREEGREHLRT